MYRYVSIEMATFQKKVNHALSLQRLKRFFWAAINCEAKSFQWLRTAGDLRSWPIWPQFLLEKLPALDSVQRILYEVECRDHYCLSVANANIVIQFKIQKLYCLKASILGKEKLQCSI